MAEGSNLGRNVKVKRVGNVLTLTIDLDKNFGPSASGKSIIVASTGGNKPIGDTGIFLGVNAYKS